MKPSVDVSIEEVRDYWGTYPADFLTTLKPGTPAFFETVRHERYQAHEPFLKEYVRFEDSKGLHVLEVGCGLGSDAYTFSSSGAHYTGIDLAPLNVSMTKKHLEYAGLPGTVLEMNAEQMTFADASFDLVYSHGVIHHSPDTEAIVAEIWRVLKPGGKALIMVYHQHSFRYYIDIMVLRRLGILVLALPGGTAIVEAFTKGRSEAVSEYKQRFLEEGFKILKSDSFLSINTDLAHNPLSKVFTRRSAKDLFQKFEGISFRTAYMDWRRFPVLRSLKTLDRFLGRLIGWFLFIQVRKPI